MPNEPTMLAASVVACARSLAGPVPVSPMQSSSATSPPSAIAMPDSISLRVRVNRSSESPCASSPSDPRRLMIDSTSRRRFWPTK